MTVVFDLRLRPASDKQAKLGDPLDRQYRSMLKGVWPKLDTLDQLSRPRHFYDTQAQMMGLLRGGPARGLPSTFRSSVLQDIPSQHWGPLQSYVGQQGGRMAYSGGAGPTEQPWTYEVPRLTPGAPQIPGYGWRQDFPTTQGYRLRQLQPGPVSRTPMEMPEYVGTARSRLGPQMGLSLAMPAEGAQAPAPEVAPAPSVPSSGPRTYGTGITAAPSPDLPPEDTTLPAGGAVPAADQALQVKSFASGEAGEAVSVYDPVTQEEKVISVPPGIQGEQLQQYIREQAEQWSRQRRSHQAYEKAQAAAKS